MLCLLLTFFFCISLFGCQLPWQPSATPDDDRVVATEGHVDVDNDGVCDDCAATVVIVLNLYAINDLHGKFADTDEQPGVDELTTYLKGESTKHDNTIFLSSGDMWQGSAESNLTKGQIVTDWMNEMDFVSMTLGNHEYDWGEQFIEDNADLAEFPLLAINVYDRQTNRLVDYATPSVIVERSGLQIGIIGAIGDCYSDIAPDHTKGVYFKTGDELTALVKAESDRLRSLGADLIVYSLHDGYGRSSSGEKFISSNQLSGYYFPELSSGYVDIVFEGHTHQSYVLEDTYGVYHLQGGGDNDGITHAEIRVNFANGKHRVTKREVVETDMYEHLSDDAIVGTLLEKYADAIAPANRAVGYNDAYRNSTFMRKLVSELYFELGLKEWGEEYDIVLGGGFISVRSPYDLERGEVRYADLQMLFPFDNLPVLCSIRGSDLVRVFFESDNDNYFVTIGEYGETVRENIDPNAIYYVVTDTYSSTYEYNNLTEIERLDRELYARDLLAEYIEGGGLSGGRSIAYTADIPALLLFGPLSKRGTLFAW